MALLGLILTLTGAVSLVMVAAGDLEVRNPGVLVATTVVGIGMLAFGLVYQALRSIFERRALALERYRGPSVLIMLAMVVLIANVAAVPFIDDVLLMISGEEIGAVEALLLLTSTQAAILLVVGLFVALPRALAGVPSFAAGKPLPSIASGIWWGAIGWVVANAVALGWIYVLEQLGLPIDPEPVEAALGIVNPVVLVFAVVVFAPLAEEIFFRGVAYTAWKREYGRRRALFGSAIVFALIHQSLPAILPIFLLGLGLAWIYERTGSLLSAVTMHATFNGITITLFLLQRYANLDLPF